MAIDVLILTHVSMFVNICFMDMCCTPITGAMTANEAEEMAGLLKVLADPARLRILSMLMRAEAGEICVCDLTEPLELTQPTVSHHMKVLREAGFTASERRGKWVYHSLVPDRIEQVRQALDPRVTVPA